MQTTHKAKQTDNGEWIEGWFVYDGRDETYWIQKVWGESERSYLIDPSTLCERVRGTEFFEGDFVNTRVNDYEFLGHLFYVESNARWSVKDIDGGFCYWLSACRDLKLTNINKHDDEG